MQYNLDKNRVANYFKQEDWYFKSIPELDILHASKENLSEKEITELSNLKIEFVNLVASLLESNQISLATTGKNYDEDRKPIDTIIIHHTGNSTLKALDTESYINALELLRLYAPVFKSKNRTNGIWSGHFYKDKMTFIPYHYLVYKDGTYTNPLNDNQIGWHAGDWDMNTRSIAVTFVDNLENAEPTINALETAKKIIKKYKNVKILGHSQVSSTICPGNLFNIEGGWKDKLL